MRFVGGDLKDFWRSALVKTCIFFGSLVVVGHIDSPRMICSCFMHK